MARINITRKWKKFFACGCSHGHLADRASLKTILDFKNKWNPDTTIHLGDFVDFAALRGGADGTSDEGVDIQGDFDAGISFLNDLQPNIVFNGNHEDRIYRLLNSNRAKVKYLASKVISDLEVSIEGMGAKHVLYDINSGWVKLGDTKFGHGYMFNMTAIRDHAETFGKCVIAHLHRVGQEPGRRIDAPVGYCVGTLADITKMTYAKTQRAKLAWSQGFAWGEYCSTETVIRLERRCNNGEWRLPL